MLATARRPPRAASRASWAIWARSRGCPSGTYGAGYRADFGTWNYHLRFAWSPLPQLSAVATGRFVGRVEQQVAGADSAFSYWTSELGVKYVY